MSQHISLRLPDDLAAALDQYRATLPRPSWAGEPTRTDAITDLLRKALTPPPASHTITATFGTPPSGKSRALSRTYPTETPATSHAVTRAREHQMTTDEAIPTITIKPEPRHQLQYADWDEEGRIFLIHKDQGLLYVDGWINNGADPDLRPELPYAYGRDDSMGRAELEEVDKWAIAHPDGWSRRPDAP